MGGYGSGRSGGRPTVEDGLTLNLNKLIREHTFCPHQQRSSSIVWTFSYTDEQAAWISFHADLGGDSPPFSKWVFRGLGPFGWQGLDRRWSWPRAWRKQRR
jgi:hypothetical protein